MGISKVFPFFFGPAFQRTCRPESDLTHFLAHSEPFLADADGIVPEVGSEVLLNEEGKDLTDPHQPSHSK